jgi:hypothetical protein
VVALLVWGVRVTALGALQLTVGPSRVTLGFSSGKQRIYDFGDPKCKLVIRGRDDPRWGLCQWSIQGGVPLYSFIPKGACDAILALARRLGLRVDQRLSTFWAGKETVYIIRGRVLTRSVGPPSA